MRWITVLLLIGLLALAPLRAAAELMVGYYPNGFIHLALPDIESHEAKARAAGSRFHLLADFYWIQGDPPGSGNMTSFINAMEAAWQRGSIPFINIASTVTLINSDWMDRYRLGWAIVNWASQGGGRRAYILLFPEMNQPWAPGFDTGPNSVAVFQNVVYTLSQTGALQYVKIVWGPMDADVPNLQAYYPGPAWFDVAGVSAYNPGSCPGAGNTFKTYDQVIAPAFQHLRTVLAGANKPLVLAQTGVGTATPAQRQDWARTLVTRLRTEPGVIGFAYYNTVDDNNCDWRLSPDQWGYAAGAADWRQ